MGTIILFVVVLSLLVFVHELGHFLMAKKMGMKVEEFGFGFPPRLFGIKKKGTIYSINWIPLGGFVRIKGESGDEKHDEDSFAHKKIWQRFVVLVAGVVMNLLLAVVLLSIGFMIGMPTTIDSTLPKGAQVEKEQISIVEVAEPSPAFSAGLVPGDALVSINDQTFATDQDARAYLLEHGKEGVVITVNQKDYATKSVTVKAEELKDLGLTAIGVAFAKTGVISFSPIQAVMQGVAATATFTWEVIKAFGGIIQNIVGGKGPGVDLSGPVGIAVLTGKVAAMGIIYLVQFAALLSINLAVINILPFPALDGGRVLFLIIEKVRGGKPVSAKFEAAMHNAGFALLMLLVVIVTYRDIVNL